MRQVHTLRISYDKTADVSYHAFGTPQGGLDQELNPGVFLRVNQETKRAVGVTILDFQQRFSDPRGASLPIDLMQSLKTK